MAYYNKVALLILNETKDRFLVCRKVPYSVTRQWIMPGGKLEEGVEVERLQAAIKESFAAAVDPETVTFIGEYSDRAAGTHDKDVCIRLYAGELLDIPKPSAEIAEVAWLSKEDRNNIAVSDVIRKKIIPDLAERGILK